ncbi:MAG: RodZ domain-containing protein [Alphaproteobacteria bacterium]
MNTSSSRLARTDDGPNVARLRAVGGGGSARLGADLRAQRLRKGLEVADVAARLRIGVNFLGAMEDGRFDDLPGPVYAVGFLRSYAEFLGLDGAEFVARLRTEGGGPAGPTELNFPEPVAPPSLPTGRIVAITLALAAVVFVAWMRLQDGVTSVSDPAAEVPAELAGAATEPVEPGIDGAARDVPVVDAPVVDAQGADAPVAPEAPPAASYVPDEPLDAAPAATASSDVASALDGTAAGPAASEVTFDPPAETETDAVTVAPTVTATPSATVTITESGAITESTAEAGPELATTATTPTAATTTTVPAATTTATTTATIEDTAQTTTDYVPTVYGRGNAGRVELRATQESWVQVTEADGGSVFTRVLRPGDVYRVPDRGGLSLRTGNAGGLEIVVDGVALPALGGLGEIRRGIVLDPDQLRAGGASGG